MNLIEQGIQKGLISFSEDKSRITYLNQNKSRNYNNPEEKVQAETFLKLVLLYNYPVNQIRQFETAKMGSIACVHIRKQSDIFCRSQSVKTPLVAAIHGKSTSLGAQTGYRGVLFFGGYKLFRSFFVHLQNNTCHLRYLLRFARGARKGQ